MRNRLAYLISIFLLASLIAKAAPLSTMVYSPIAKITSLQQDEKIDYENEKLTSYNQLKNDEFTSSYAHYPISITSSNIQFIYISSIVPYSYLKRPERPPKRDLF
ncbi:MAG: hypothetical protein EOO07_09290 [Chitinophagaceae bacterium]|nr:MAG: hypothetical protein EOO07_09290 [Chitinophagaceae bacterium]